MDELDRQIEQLRRCEYIKESEVRDLCNLAKEILIEEPNIQQIYSPITVRTFSCFALTSHTFCRFVVISTANSTT